MIIPYASHAPLHTAQQSSHSSCLIKPRAHQITLLSLALFLMYFLSVQQNVGSKCSICVATSCLFSPRASLMLLVLDAEPSVRLCGCSWEVYHWRGVTEDGMESGSLLGHGQEGMEGRGAQPAFRQKLAGTNNWQVALKTDQLICMRQISIVVRPKEKRTEYHVLSLFRVAQGCL